MDQKKIGLFIARLRKEHNMTQQQLADAIGVSNKTISKWECGKGLPELSSIQPLCQLLDININELILGERIAELELQEKADENIVKLIEETELLKNKKRYSLPGILVSFMFFFLFLWLLLGSNMGWHLYHLYFDAITLTAMIGITLIYLIGTGMLKPFISVFSYLIGKKYQRNDLVQSICAMKLVGNTMLAVGGLVSCISFMSIRPIGQINDLFFETMNISISIALNGILYGLIGYLMLLPIRIKLQSELDKE